MRRRPCAGSTLGQRRRRWTNVEPAQGQRLVFAGTVVLMQQIIHLLINLPIHNCTDIVWKQIGGNGTSFSDHGSTLFFTAHH